MKKLLLAMSGGIDSSVAAILLKEKYELVGMTFRSYDSISKACMEKETGCCSVDSIFGAKRLAQDLGFPHHILDVRDLFERTVIADFISEYIAGRTPNPCVVCNKNIKWGRMIQEADTLGCEFLATGHYARIACENGRYFLRKGVDLNKDQTYFLWALSQENMARTVFPLGDYEKSKVREIAAENGYVKLSQKKESQEICFIPNDNYRDFLREQIPDIDIKIGKGNILDTSGKILGQHSGYPFYTIGQRRGLEVAMGHPVYVTNIDASKNTVTLGEREDLLKSEIYVSNLNMMKYDNLDNSRELVCKIRYNNKGMRCEAQQFGDKLKVIFEQPVSAVTSGQSAVLYEGDDVVCGGIIC